MMKNGWWIERWGGWMDGWVGGWRLVDDDGGWSVVDGWRWGGWMDGWWMDGGWIVDDR